MSQSEDTRRCPRCDSELSGREHHGEGGLTVIWQCSCGWASARTVSREEEFRRPRTASGVGMAPVADTRGSAREQEPEPPSSSSKQRR